MLGNGLVIAGWFLVIIAYIFTLGYRKNYRKNVDKSKHKLWMIYGLAMYLVDKPLKKIIFKTDKVLEKNFKSLYVKENIKEQKYLYIVSKIAIVIAVMWVTGTVTITLDIAYQTKDKKITYIRRNEFSEGETIYNLQADVGGEKESIEIYVSPKEYTDEELLKILEDYREELIKVLLGENESQDRICKAINLVSSIGEENIPVVWEFEEGVINKDGTLGKNISSEGTIVTLKANLSIRNISVVHEIVLNVYPSDEKADLQEQIQKKVDESDPNVSKIKLPKMIGGNSVVYSKVEDNVSIYFLLIGMVAAMAIYFLKDKEMEKQMSHRNQQMLLDYAEIVSKIMLLCKAGMSMRKAWEQVLISAGNKKEHYVYKEVKMMLAKINSGRTESQAYEEFGRRCGMHCYIRFANILSQNVKRGTNDLCKALEFEMNNALLERKNSALKRGEEAGTKLLGPMVIMLILGLGYIVIPAFMSVNI